jgi:acetate kinase
VLVLNAGSSSLKYSLVEGDTGASLAGGLVERIGESSGVLAHRTEDGVDRLEQPIGSHEEALNTCWPPSTSVASPASTWHDRHRWCGRRRFAAPSSSTRGGGESAGRSPLCTPRTSGSGSRRIFPDLPHVAVFDTAFHQTLPEHAYTYAVPRAWRDKHQVRRYGFHGTSHAFVSREAARLLGQDPADVNVIVLHLGNGASATAVSGGRSVDTSMGMTPLEGLVMAALRRSPSHLPERWSLEEIDRVLNRESGLKGMAGENDFRELEQMIDAGDEAAKLAFDVYCYRIRKYVGAYTAVLGRVDAIVFTAGVGQHAASVRAASLLGLETMGVVVDASLNEAASGQEPAVVSSPTSRVAVMVVPTNEEGEIARQSLAVVPS